MLVSKTKPTYSQLLKYIRNTPLWFEWQTCRKFILMSIQGLICSVILKPGNHPLSPLYHTIVLKKKKNPHLLFKKMLLGLVVAERIFKTWTTRRVKFLSSSWLDRDTKTVVLRVVNYSCHLNMSTMKGWQFSCQQWQLFLISHVNRSTQLMIS